MQLKNKCCIIGSHFWKKPLVWKPFRLRMRATITPAVGMQENRVFRWCLADQFLFSYKCYDTWCVFIINFIGTISCMEVIEMNSLTCLANTPVSPDLPKRKRGSREKKGKSQFKWCVVSQRKPEVGNTIHCFLSHLYFCGPLIMWAYIFMFHDL